MRDSGEWLTVAFGVIIMIAIYIGVTLIMFAVFNSFLDTPIAVALSLVISLAIAGAFIWAMASNSSTTSIGCVTVFVVFSGLAGSTLTLVAILI